MAKILRKIVSDEVFNALEWVRKSVTAADEEMAGYRVIGVEPCIGFYREDNHEPTADAFFIYLERETENTIKIIMFDAGMVYMDEDEQRNASPIEISIAYAAKSGMCE